MVDLNQQSTLLESVQKTLGGLDEVLIAYGSLSDQKKCEASVVQSIQELNINFISVVGWLTRLGNYFESQKQGTIAVISSVAGDRGRQSNYVYGTAKGAVNVFLQGLRNRLAKSGVQVLTIKPGFVDTPMTAHLPKNFLFASAQKVGKGIVKAIDKKKDVVYLPGFWRLILWIINRVPEKIFKKLSL